MCLNNRNVSKNSNDVRKAARLCDTEDSTTETDNSDSRVSVSPLETANDDVLESVVSNRVTICYTVEVHTVDESRFFRDCEQEVENNSTARSRHGSLTELHDQGYSDVRHQTSSDLDSSTELNNSGRKQQCLQGIQETSGLDGHSQYQCDNVSSQETLQETCSACVQTQDQAVNVNFRQTSNLDRKSAQISGHKVFNEYDIPQTTYSIDHLYSRLFEPASDIESLHLCSDVGEFRSISDTDCEKGSYPDIKSLTDSFCSLCKYYSAKTIWTSILKHFPYETGYQCEFSADKSNTYSKLDSADKNFIKTLRDQVAPPVQNTFYGNQIFTVLPVTGTLATSEQQSTSSSSTQSGFEPLLTIINRIADGVRVPPQITMRYEMLRFCTLRSFPRENKPFITRLAGAGFYYANNGDEVVCYSCARRKSNWRESDDPMDVHRQMNPNCSFLIRNSEVNVPIRQVTESSSVAVDSSSNAGNTTSGSHLESGPRSSSQNNIDSVSDISASIDRSRLRSNSNVQQDLTDENVSSVQHASALTGTQTRVTESSDSMAATSVTSSRRTNQSISVFSVDVPETQLGYRPTNTSTGGINQPTRPKHPNYCSKADRLTSFVDCGDIVVTPDTLADAGFFYAGFGDCVRCFQCGVGLRHWSQEDDPWIEHCRWSKECSYVRQMKGQEFVNLVQLAVRYSQNQNGDGQTLSQDAHGAAGGECEADRLMHTDAAQSVLEMGYHPDVIQRAISMIISSADRQSVTAANLMEKIFEIEESDTQQRDIPSDAQLRSIPSDAQQRDIPRDSETRQSHQQDIDSAHTSTGESRTIPEEPLETLNSQREGNEDVEAVGGDSETGDSRTLNDKEENKSPDDTTKKTVSEEDRHVSGDQASGTDLGNTTESRRLAMPTSLPTGSSSSATRTGRETATARKAHLLEQKRLKEENKKFKQQSICTKCNKNGVCIVFLPCGHLVTCEECAPTVRYCTIDTCGRYIKGTVRTYSAKLM